MCYGKMVEFKTRAAGPFCITWDYDEQAVRDALTRIHATYDAIRELPIVPALMAGLEEDIIRRSVHGTAALEGNPLSEKEVGELLSSRSPAEAKNKAEQEILNLREAYERIRSTEPSSEPVTLDEEYIRTLHVIVVRNIDSPDYKPGEYRVKSVRVGDADHGGTWRPPRCREDIETAMRTFIAVINSDDILAVDPILRAAMAHYYIGKIHPFRDGNGRTARLVEALLLRHAGFRHVPPLLANYYYRHIDEYFWAFSDTHKTSPPRLTPFYEFILGALESVLDEWRTKIYLFIRDVVLKDFLVFLRSNREITYRQYQFLLILIDQDEPFTSNDLTTKPVFSPLYQNVSRRTMLRDIRKLMDIGVIRKEQDGSYTLNRFILDSL